MDEDEEPEWGLFEFVVLVVWVALIVGLFFLVGHSSTTDPSTPVIVVGG